MRILIDPDDRRSVAGLLLAGEATSWGRVVNRASGEVAYAIPSQTWKDVFHIATADNCTCVDHKRGNTCKHERAVRLYELLRRTPQPKRRRLRPVPNVVDEFHPSV